MNQKQVASARRILLQYSDRVRIRIERDGPLTTLTPYLIASPATEGAGITITRDLTNDAAVAQAMISSIENLLG